MHFAPPVSIASKVARSLGYPLGKPTIPDRGVLSLASPYVFLVAEIQTRILYLTYQRFLMQILKFALRLPLVPAGPITVQLLAFVHYSEILFHSALDLFRVKF